VVRNIYSAAEFVMNNDSPFAAF